MIVVNATVLSNLAIAKRLKILRELYDKVLVPYPVYEEILKGIEASYIFLDRVDKLMESEDWISLVYFTDESRKTFKALLDVLGRGEAAGIAMAEEQHLTFFSDDKVARNIARDRRVKISGTIGILKVAVEEYKISINEADVVLRKMIQGGYRSPIRSIKEVLAKNESD